MEPENGDRPHGTEPPDAGPPATVVRSWGDDHPVSTAVVLAVAAAEGVSPVEIDARLAERVDPDALNDLFAPVEPCGHATGHVTFMFAGYRVLVTSHGEISVGPPATVRANGLDTS